MSVKSSLLAVAFIPAALLPLAGCPGPSSRSLTGPDCFASAEVDGGDSRDGVSPSETRFSDRSGPRARAESGCVGGGLEEASE